MLVVVVEMLIGRVGAGPYRIRKLGQGGCG